MADKRINALANTAPNTASDDFIAIDGTTNGTRKLSAFSPTFGGNVVVTGTLTSQSTLSTAAGLSCANADITGGYIILRGYGSQDGGLVFFGQSANNNFINSNATTISTSIAGSAVSNNVAAGFRVLTTTASTTTSSGALVVGNGTSGGLGVGGNTSIGGYIRAGLSIYADGTVPSGLEAAYRVDVQNATTRDVLAFGDGSRQGLLRGYHDGSGGINFRFGRYTAALGFEEHVRINGSTAANTIVNIYGTTASTSTSSGALVVSGGVGVGGRINSGNGLTISADSDTQISFVRNGTVSIGPDNTATPALVVSSAIKTSAPSGGTAANWKLGTVASVSPTSPNRTIEVDIGGTIYYIHAKTTNN